MSLSEEKIKAQVERLRTYAAHNPSALITEIADELSAVRKEQAVEIARLKEELDRALIVGSIEIAKLREANAELLHAFADAYNELKEWAKDEGDAYNCPAWNAIIAKHGGES